MREGEVLTSHTLPGQSHPNVKCAGQHKERVIGFDASTQQPIIQRVVFDEKGFPIFDLYVKSETRITGDLGNMRGEKHLV